MNGWQTHREHRFSMRRLPAVLDDDLGSRQRRRLMAHAAGCPECGPPVSLASGTPSPAAAVREGEADPTSAGAPRLRIHDMMPATMTDELSDDALVTRAQAGDVVAFEELVQRNAGRLHAVVRRLVGDEHEAQEVTQEAFLRAWRGIGSFKLDAKFSTWLYRIGVNEANRRLKRTANVAAQRSLQDLVHEPVEPGPGPAGQAERGDLQRALERAVRDLHPDYRAPLVLRDIEGLSTDEAAAIMGLKPAAFKSRLHRARLTVRDAVAGYL